MATDLERYGVFALVFVVLLIVGISIWGPQREDEPLLAAAGAAAGESAPAPAEPQPVSGGAAVLGDPGADARLERLTSFYKVLDGDNPTKIARKLYGSGERYVTALMEANPEARAKRLRADDLLRLPVVDKEPDARYVIPGHELAPLAIASEEALQRIANGGAGSGAGASPSAQAPAPSPSPQERPPQNAASGGGEKVKAASPRTASAPRAERYHVVRHGEKLEKIAKRYYGSAAHVAKIQAANPKVKDPDQIRAGMKLILP